MRIADIDAREVLDSRGNPTIEVSCRLADGASARASVPSGRSTGGGEAVELRDGDSRRYRGRGCRRAVASVTGEIRDALVRREFEHQSTLDRALRDLDGTDNAARLGANALLGVSLAFARAHAASCGLALYDHFAKLAGVSPRLPGLSINLFSGGEHGGRQMAVQDILVVPDHDCVDDGLAFMHEVYARAAQWQQAHFGQRLLRADEGGLAPPFARVVDALDTATAMIDAAGGGASLAMDVAASHFYHEGRYRIDDENLDAPALIDRIGTWCEQYRLRSVEDGLYEDAWDDWPRLRHRLDGRAHVLGDDLLCTQPERIRRAVAADACNALLLKVNQVGTLSDALEALQLARAAGWSVTVSARSGETEDNWLADLAVGWAADYIKVGSITQSERLAKYNRLLEIEAHLGPAR